MKIKTVCFMKLNLGYLENPYSDPPLGLLYTLASTQKSGYEVFFCDYDINNPCPIPKADVYAFSSMTRDYVQTQRIALLVKEKYPKAKTIIGGVHPSIFPQAVNTRIFDGMYRGEGELLPTYLSMWEEGIPLKTFGARRITDLDQIPFPAREFLDKDLYFNQRGVFRGAKFSDGKATTMITSRGCPFSCAFCSSPKIWGRQVCYHSADYVLREVDHLMENYDIGEIRFQDDNMTLNRPRLIKICNGLRDRWIYWRASTRVSLLDRDMVELLLHGGCREICLGIESMESEVLNLLDKGTTPEQNITAATLAKAAGLRVRVLLMTGLPGESPDAADKMIEFLESVKPDVVTMNTFFPIPGSEVFDYPEKYDGKVLMKNPFQEGFDFALKYEPMTPFGFKPNLLSLGQMERNREKLKSYIFNRGLSNVFKFNGPYGKDRLGDEVPG